MSFYSASDWPVYFRSSAPEQSPQLSKCFKDWSINKLVGQIFLLMSQHALQEFSRAWMTQLCNVIVMKPRENDDTNSYTKHIMNRACMTT